MRPSATALTVDGISRLGIPKDDLVAAITAEIARCEASPPCGPVVEVLLVGYSQGGMDAQNLAFWNALGTPIAGVVTFGSPIIAANPFVTTLHIQDSLDGIVITKEAVSRRLALNPATLVLLEGPKVWAVGHGDIYEARSGTPVAAGRKRSCRDAGKIDRNRQAT